MTSPAPINWTATGNDYRGIERLEPGPAPSVLVVVTGDASGHESVARALKSSQYEASIEVVSAEAVDASVDADVVLLLDSRASAEPDMVARHAGWHRRVANAVVIGSNPEDALRGGLLRRSRRLLSGDEAFTAMSSSNVSMRRDHWLRAYEDHPVDEVAGWRLWNDGLTFVYEPEAVVSTGDRARHPATDPFHLADQIPHGRYRRVPSGLHATPKVSWVVGVTDRASADRAWETCLRSSFADEEAVFWGPARALESLAGLDTSTSRVRTVVGDAPDAFARAVAAGRGELLAILDPEATVPAEVLAKAVARYGAKPKVSLVRAGYSVGGDRYLRFDDIAAIDEEVNGAGLPHFALVSRRELMKEPGLAVDPGAAWRSVVARCSPALVISPLVEIGGPVSVRPRLPGVSELPTVGLEELARTVVRERRRRSATDQASNVDEQVGEDRVSVAYVGFAGYDNLGDEAVLVAIERLMPWAVFDPDPVDPQLLMVGGGTLINGRKYYLTRLLRQESAVVERALFGTGVRSPGFWGVTEPMEDWFSFIDSALVAGVRGPDSVRNLRELGYHSNVPVIGDPALSLRPSDDVARVEGRVVVCPVHTGGNLHGGDDAAVFDALATLIGEMRSEGREVVMMTAYSPDDRWAIDIMDRAGARDMTYVAGYDDIDATMDLLASADLVVGERLHAIVLAAAAGTPFVGLEYRPKLRDFAKSIGQDQAVIRTDEMDRLGEVVTRVLGDRAAILGSTGEKVAEFRRKQEQLAAELRSRLEALRG